jgi:DnaK suppressor protein
MKSGELDQFKKILRDLLEGVAQPLRRREEIAVENASDELDRVQGASERDLAIRQIESDALRLQDLKSALERVQDGSYGTCLRCEEPISLKRMAAIPWASYCVRCQAIVDEEKKHTLQHELMASF